MGFETGSEKTDPSPRKNRGVRDDNLAETTPNARVHCPFSIIPAVVLGVIFFHASSFSRPFSSSMLVRFSIWMLDALYPAHRSLRGGLGTSPTRCAQCLPGWRIEAASGVT